MQGSPSQTGSWGAGVGEGDTGVPQHPQSCPGMMPQQRGCSRAGVHPAIVRAGGSRAATPAGPPTTHFWAAGSWAQSQGAAGGGGLAALGAAEVVGPAQRKEASREKTKILKKKTQTRQAPTSALCPGSKGATGRARGAVGRQPCSRAGRMRPSDRGWGVASTAEPRLGSAGACLMLVGTRGQGGWVIWDATT